jgi:hypothetical protein
MLMKRFPATLIGTFVQVCFGCELQSICYRHLYLHAKSLVIDASQKLSR